MSSPLLNAILTPPVTAVVVMVLAALAAFETSRRGRERERGDGLAWHLASAVALGSGLWCVQLLGLAQLPDTTAASMQPVASGLALALAIALCVAALGWPSAPLPAALRGVAEACTLGLGATASQALLLWALGLHASFQWQLSAWALAGAMAGGGLACALHLSRLKRRRHRGVWQTLAAAVACISVWLCHVVSIDASGGGALVLAAPGDDLSLHTLAMIGPTVCSAVLMLMLLACAVESRFTLAQRKQRTAVHLPQHDELTGLPNRTLFEGRLAQALSAAEHAGHEVVLMLVALDGFKHVNEELGHQQGDEVLKRTAQALRWLAPPHGVARLGGDEFLLLVSGAGAAQRSAELANRILDAVAVPWSAQGQEHTVACSIGLAIYPKHGASSALLSHANIAMRAAKAAGGASHAIFDPQMVNRSRERAELLADLRQALARKQLELYYQPKIHAPSAQIMGVEALLRWHHPQRGIISPEVFIPMAERHGLINSLGDWVIDEACQQARLWRDAGLRMRVAINVSVHQLNNRGFASRIDDALKRHRINPALLTCEITESVAMQDTEVTLRVFAEVAALGVHLSIDDFGSGYSSLGYLRKLPAEELKIDRSFVLDLENSSEARKIAKAVVSLAQSLNMTVVAEGVETEAQQRILRGLGCDQLQGFLFAKPMSAKALTLWALADEGPRSMQFRESLFHETQSFAL